MDNLSQHSDEMDDDIDRPASPQLPLSLTTHERRHSLSPNQSTPIKIEPNFIENKNSNNNSGSNSNVINMNNFLHTDRFMDLRAHEQQSSLRSNIEDSNNDDSSNKSQRNNSIKDSPQSEEDLDMEGSDINPMDEYRSPSPSFPILPNSMFSHSIMYMSHYIPQISQASAAGSLLPSPSPSTLSQNAVCGLNLSNDERRKRNRTFIDPVTEVPKLEQWFAMNTHPSHNLILKYTEDLNRMPYR